ncbi:MAG TPA: ATP-binding protein [Vicinamibacteria bacterium]|nr:ATP-binding protein [Vicinamibacteria bacterium]
MKPEGAESLTGDGAGRLFSGAHYWVAPVALLFLAQLCAVVFLGPRGAGPAFADVVALFIFLLSVFVFLRAARASHSVARPFWSIAALSSVLYCVGALLFLYTEVISASAPVAALADVISVFYFAPVGLTLFLEPAFELRRFDRIHLLDAIQLLLVWIAVYLFFEHPPAQGAAVLPFAHGWLRQPWGYIFVYDALMAATFLLRAAITNSRTVRALFGRVGLVLLFSWAADFYYNYLGLQAGTWYEIIWTLLAIAPIVIAATWSEADIEPPGDRLPTGDFAAGALFGPLFTFLVLLLSLGIVGVRPKLALGIAGVSFACSSLHLVIVQQRQQRTHVELRAQVVERERIESQLRKHEQHLEEEVADRTKRLEESRAQLFQAQKMEAIGRLAGGVAHDFNNLLHVIMGFVELLRRKMPADTRVSRYVDEIEGAAGRAQDVTSQLLAFSRRQVISPAPSDLNALVTRLSRGLSRLIGEDVELRVEGAEGLWPVNVDPTQIDQVLLNLAVNARDAMPNGGMLTIEMANIRVDETFCRQHAAARPGDYVLLAVSDTGTGMDKETLSHAFEPFFTTKEKGTGLGLATVHGIVEQNGGFVNAYSEPGQGTTFKIYLPRALEAGTPAAEAAEPPNYLGAGTVLVVEDEESVRRVTAELVQSLGYEVMTACSGDEAIELCEAHEPRIDVVLTDVVMTGTSGTELRDRLERLRPGIKILFTSGYATNVIAHRGILDKGVHFIAKPFGITHLARALRELLAAGRELDL